MWRSMVDVTPRPPSASRTEMTEIVLPQHANAIGTTFGGVVMGWIDICGAVAAHRHCGRVAVTAAVDEMAFRAPIRVGDVVVLRSRVHAAFRTSLEMDEHRMGSATSLPEEPEEWPEEVIAEGRVVSLRPHSAGLFITRSTTPVENGDHAEMREGY